MDRIKAALLRAVEAGVISFASAHAIAACFFRYDDSSTLGMDFSALTEDELDAMDAVSVWLEDQE